MMKVRFLAILLAGVALQSCSATMESPKGIEDEARIFREIHTTIPITILAIDKLETLLQKPSSDWRSVQTQVITGTYMGEEITVRINTYNFGSTFYRHDQPGPTAPDKGVRVDWHEGGTSVNDVLLPKVDSEDGKDMQWFGPVHISDMEFTKEDGESSDNIRKLTSSIYVLMENKEVDLGYKKVCIELKNIVQMTEFHKKEIDGITCSRKDYTWSFSSGGFVKAAPSVNKIIF